MTKLKVFSVRNVNRIFIAHININSIDVAVGTEFSDGELSIFLWF